MQNGAGFKTKTSEDIEHFHRRFDTLEDGVRDLVTSIGAHTVAVNSQSEILKKQLEKQNNSIDTKTVYYLLGIVAASAAGGKLLADLIAILSKLLGT